MSAEQNNPALVSQLQAALKVSRGTQKAAEAEVALLLTKGDAEGAARKGALVNAQRAIADGLAMKLRLMGVNVE